VNNKDVTFYKNVTEDSKIADMNITYGVFAQRHEGFRLSFKAATIKVGTLLYDICFEMSPWGKPSWTCTVKKVGLSVDSLKGKFTIKTPKGIQVAGYGFDTTIKLSTEVNYALKTVLDSMHDAIQIAIGRHHADMILSGVIVQDLRWKAKALRTQAERIVAVQSSVTGDEEEEYIVS
jgi:hypothetical protein